MEQFAVNESRLRTFLLLISICRIIVAPQFEVKKGRPLLKFYRMFDNQDHKSANFFLLLIAFKNTEEKVSFKCLP